MSAKDSSRYYWIKFKTDFLTSPVFDCIMRQKNGAEYAVLYECLCLLAINSKGVLADYIGEIFIPYDENKIQGLCKSWFSIDTIRVGLELFKSLGLVFRNENGILELVNFSELIGSETKAAERMRLTRANERLQIEKRTNGEQCSLDIRDKSLDSEDMKKINSDLQEKGVLSSTLKEDLKGKGGDSSYERINSKLPF